jgi:CheY-like chemotaxis protein
MVHRTILVVDDDADLRDAIAGVLEEADYRVVQAADGLEALAILAKEKADLILLDLMMPVMDGFRFRAEQRRQPGIAEIPVVLLSAGRPPREDSAVASDRFVPKPVAPLELLRIVSESLQKI